MLIEIAKLLVSPLSAVIIGICAYFYKRHIDKIDKYQAALEEARYIMEMNHTILNRPSPDKEIMYNELMFIPAFTLHEFPPFDYSIRLAILAHNTYIASPKLGVTEDTLPIPKVKEAIIQSLGTIFRSQVFIDNISGKNMLKYYAIRSLLNKELKHFCDSENDKGDNACKNSQPSE